jgi:hypothetical protein
LWRSHGVQDFDIGGLDWADRRLRPAGNATIDTLIDHYPHMKMMDGKITLNDRCPVRRVPLNLRLPTLYVNEQPIGFC